MRAPRCSLALRLPALPLLALLLACGAEEPSPPAPPGETPPWDLAAPVPAGEVRAGVIGKAEELIGGLKADGQVGDLKLYNSHVAFVVEGVRPASGYRFWGGNLVDADVVRPAGEPGRDLYGEIFFAWDLQIFRPERVELLSDGSSGRAHVRFTGKSVAFAWADSFVRDLADPPPADLDVTFDYSLGPDDEALRLDVTLTNPRAEPWEIGYPFVLANQGDGASTYATGVGLGGLTGAGHVRWVGSVSRDLAYGFVALQPDLAVLFEYSSVTLLLREELTFDAGGRLTFSHFFAVTDRGAAGLDDAARELLAEAATGRLVGMVELPSTVPPDDAWVAVKSGDDVATVAPIGDDGAFAVSLPPGQYQVQAFAHHHAFEPPVSVAVALGADAAVALSIPEAARATATVTDSAGAPLPGRVTFLRADGGAEPFPPEDVRFGGVWRDGVAGVLYAAEGEGEVLLPAGDYRAVASRGFSFELAEQPVHLEPGGEVALAFTLVRAVDTSGWLSADFHLHAQKSPDSDVPYDVRVRQALTEDVDIPVLTEHVYAAGLQGTADELGFGGKLHGVIGQEVTTFAYGHFNAFPLIWDPSAVNAGGVVEHGRTVPELFAAMRAQNPAEELIQVNHPRALSPGGYFSYVGLDAANDQVARPEGWVTDFDTVEAFTGGCAPDDPARADWIGLTNHGHRKALSSGSDSHSESKLPGTPRNWIEVDAAALRADHQALVPVVKARRMFVSCGPFVRFAAADGTGLGGMIGVSAAGEASFTIKVEAPAFVQLHEARLLENGIPVQTFQLGQTGEPLRLDTTATVHPAADAWYALEVLGSGSLVPVTWSSGPYALTNPIEVDVDGDGVWTAPGG